MEDDFASECDKTFVEDLDEIPDGCCSDSDCECLELLIPRETLFYSTLRSVSSSGSPLFDFSWFSTVRTNVIHSLIEMKYEFFVQFGTVYLALHYFDRFFSTTNDAEPSTARLISVACVSLAAKMEEVWRPWLSQYQRDKEFGFDWGMIQNMELMVLEELEWRLTPFTPFTYFHCFIPNLGIPFKSLVKLLPKTMKLVLALVKTVDLVEYPPSAIAAAALLVASGTKFTSMPTEKTSISLWERLDRKRVSSCCNLLLGTPNDMISPTVTSNNPSWDDFPEDPLITDGDPFKTLADLRAGRAKAIAQQSQLVAHLARLAEKIARLDRLIVYFEPLIPDSAFSFSSSSSDDDDGQSASDSPPSG